MDLLSRSPRSEVAHRYLIAALVALLLLFGCAAPESPESKEEPSAAKVLTKGGRFAV